MAIVSKKLLLGTIQKERAEQVLREKARELAGAIAEALPKGHGYFVILADDRGTQAFVTDAERAEAVQLLRSVLARLEGS